MLCDGLTASTSTVLNYYVDVNGEEAVLYVTRNAPMMKMLFDGDNFAGTKFTCPNKGACNGMDDDTKAKIKDFLKSKGLKSFKDKEEFTLDMLQEAADILGVG